MWSKEMLKWVWSREIFVGVVGKEGGESVNKVGVTGREQVFE